MPRAPALLKVLPNPWHGALDHEGRPSTPCSREAQRGAGHPGYVGATCVAEAPKALEKGHGSLVSSDQDTTWRFSRDVQTVPATDYYKMCVADGVLIAADEATAKTAGVKLRPAAEVWAESKAAAAARWVAAFGETPPDVDPFEPSAAAPAADASKKGAK